MTGDFINAIGTSGQYGSSLAAGVQVTLPPEAGRL
jgi:hypothetical protein